MRPGSSPSGRGSQELAPPCTGLQPHPSLPIDLHRRPLPQVPPAPRPSSSASATHSYGSTLASDYLPSEFTDLTDYDVLVSRVDSRNGEEYEALLLLSQFIGPAGEPPKVKKWPSSVIAYGEVQLARRRLLQDGRVKIKLSLLGNSVGNCGVCLSQFKANDPACCIVQCTHSFHQACMDRWLADHSSCPLCRHSLDEQ